MPAQVIGLHAVSDRAVEAAFQLAFDRVGSAVFKVTNLRRDKLPPKHDKCTVPISYTYCKDSTAEKVPEVGNEQASRRRTSATRTPAPSSPRLRREQIPALLGTG